MTAQPWRWTVQFDLIDMQLFIRIAESSSLALAAEQSRMSLAAATRRINKLHQRLGAKLLYQRGQGLTFTPAGQRFLVHSRVVMQGTERLLDEMQWYASGAKGNVRISADANSIEFLPSVLSAFLSKYPGVSVDLKEQLTSDVVPAVSGGRTDMGIVSGREHAAGLQTLPYKRDRLVLAVALHHPVSRRRAIAFGETLEFDYIGLEGNSISLLSGGTVRELDKFSKARIQVGTLGALCRMVEANLGVGILPESIARRHEKSMAIRILRLTDSWAERQLQIFVRRGSLPQFANDLINLLAQGGTADLAGQAGNTQPSRGEVAQNHLGDIPSSLPTVAQ
jgi:DNA-binding transcriptional LysR family regulator